MKIIITHAGMFHADELVAIALLKLFYTEINFEIKRVSQVAQGDFDDNNVFVIDIGRDFNPEKLNFDHHHDSDLPASNILIADWLVSQGKMSNQTRDSLQPLLIYISDVDKGVIPGGGYRYGFNSLIKSFNDSENPEAFDNALAVVVLLLQQQLRQASEAEKSELYWNELERITPQVVLSKTNQVIIGWKGLALKEGVKYMVTPSDHGGFNVISVDSEQYPIAPDNRQTFLHNSGFMASYSNEEDAINHALEMCKL